MSRLTAPTRENGGKNAWRHLTTDELSMVAAYAVEYGAQNTKKRFGISYTTVSRACKLGGVKPAPHPFGGMRKNERAST